LQQNSSLSHSRFNGRDWRRFLRVTGSLCRGVEICLIFAVLAAAPSCSRQKTVSKIPRISDYEKNERVFQTNQEAVKAGVYEEFVDSMLLKGQTGATERKAPKGPTAPAVTPAPGELAPDVMMGFRVQLGAFSDQEGAENFAARARNQLGVKYSVYVRYYAPLWKVHAGDCRTREEAEVLCGFMQRSGYPDAWIVSSGIKR